VTRELRRADTELQHLEALIADRNRCNEARLLPKSVYLLQDSSLLCLHHHYVSGQSPVISDFNHIGQNDQFSLRVNLGDERQQNRTINVKVNDFPYSFYDPRSGDLYLQKQLEEGLTWPFIESVMEPLRDMKKQNSFIPTQATLLGLELDASRELQMIGVDPYGAVARVIGFGRHNVDLLKNNLIIDFFRLQLFRNGQLLSQMEDKAAFAKNIRGFFIDAIGHHQQKGDLATCLSLAKLGNDVKVFITQAGYQDVVLPDFRKIVCEEFVKEVNENNKLSPNAKWGAKRLIYETLVTFYEKIDVEDLIKNPFLQGHAATDILGFLIARNMEGQAVKNNHVACAVLLKFKSLLNDHIKDGSFFNRDEIFNSAIKLIDHTFKGGSKWEGGPRVYYNDKYIIDIEEGSIIDKAMGRVGPVPAAILNNEDFKKIFIERIENCKQNGSVYVINEGLPSELTVFFTIDGGLGFERKIKNKIYRYTPFPNELEQRAPTLAEPKLCCWVCDDDQDRHMIALEDGKKVFEAQLERGHGAPNTIGYTLKKVIKKNDQKRQLRWVPATCFNGLVRNHFLKGLDIFNLQHIECWVNGNDQEPNDQNLVEVKVKELGLSFVVRSIEGKTYLVCQQFPGYYLVENPTIPLLGESLKYFTLENFAGERKVLIPDQPIVGTSVMGYSRKASQNLQFSVERPIRWLEFELKEESLNTRNIEGRFAQITLLVVQGNYEEAFNLLNKTDSMERFVDDPLLGGAKERTVILHLMKTLVMSHHPAAQAMLLHLIIKTEENRLKYPLKERRSDEPALLDEEPYYASIREVLRTGVNLYESLIHIYTKYLSTESNATLYRLNEKQKATFFGLIEKEINKEREATGSTSAKLAYKALLYHLRSDFADYLQKGTTKLGIKTDVHWWGEHWWREVRNLSRAVAGTEILEPSALLGMFENYDRETMEADIT
ncbi:MAG TPA: hypothetical protein VIH61_06160, partial [Waddliaceae bacterium]